MSVPRRAAFPFSALLGQEALRQALLLLAIDPRIGGLLIEGPRGTAKSTSARALADLLPAGAFVTLPLGATQEMLIGTLDVEAALRGGEVRFSPGLLARAHEGVLYVDEVNLLPDELVDQLLDVAASGVNVIERDGISHAHAARFALVGTMNPQEGELRPQLLDRFGLALAVDEPVEPVMRAEIVQRRLAFEDTPHVVADRFATQQAELQHRVLHARERLPHLTIGADVQIHVSALCLAAHAEGLRADLAMTRAARALAALSGDIAVSPGHVDSVAELALRHRRRASPEEPVSLTRNQGTSENQPSRRDPDQRDGRLSGNGAHSAKSPATANEATADEAEWGELAPSPVAALPARGVSLRPEKKRP